MSTNWFQELLQKEAKDRGFNVTEMASFLGLVRETYDRWQSGFRKPNILQAAEVLKKLGGDINRALPNYIPPSYEQAEKETKAKYRDAVPLMEMPVAGRISAGPVDWIDSGDEDPVLATPELWRNNRYWKLSNPYRNPNTGETHEVVLLKVSGDSMDPEFTHGEILAFRVPKNVPDLPDGTPCIIQERGRGQTFKLLYRATNNKTLTALPINRRHRPTTFSGTSEDVEIPFMFVGKLDPAKDDSRGGVATNIPGLRKGI